MAAAERPTYQLSRSQRDWTISYTQGDVDAIREQVEQTESAKRRWLLLALIITVAGLVITVAILSTSYALLAGSNSEKKRLSDENAGLKIQAGQAQQELDASRAQSAKQHQTRAEAQAKLQSLLPAVLNSQASYADIARFARMVYQLPDRRIETDQRPPDGLFRNWKVSVDSTTEIYTLVGGFVDGKWVVYSNLVSRSTS